MSDCRFGVSPVNYPDPDPELQALKGNKFVYSYHPGWGYRNEPRSQVSMCLMQKVL